MLSFPEELISQVFNQYSPNNYSYKILSEYIYIYAHIHSSEELRKYSSYIFHIYINTHSTHICMLGICVSYVYEITFLKKIIIFLNFSSKSDCSSNSEQGGIHL